MIRKILLAAAFTAMLAATAHAQQIKLTGEEEKAIKEIRKVQIAQMAISQLYVDTVNTHKLAEDAIKGMLKELDPHSSYSTPKEVKQLTEPLQGNFEGIGVQFNLIDDTLLVIQPTLNGPSEKVGIVAGDRIVSVNDTAIAGVKMERDKIVSKLRGPKGTQVKLGVVRRGVPDKLYFNVVRDKIPVNTLVAAYMVRPGIGLIRLESFGATSHDELVDACDSLKKQGMKKLILDLQQNGGGLLKAAVDISNEFLKDGEKIVYTEGRTVPRFDYKANGKGTLKKMPVVVMIDEFSASASEIVTGALQDHDRAMVVGRRSFGKGLVQRPIEMPDGSMIRLTVAHYYTPVGRCIQKPYKKGDLKEYEMDYENRLKHGELTNPDSIHFADSLKYYTLNKHRTVYGGGGIMPDYFIPLDTTQYTRFHRQLAVKSIIIQQVLKYIDQNRASLKNDYPTFDRFEQQFSVPQELIDRMVAEAEKQKVKPKDEEELQKTLPRLRLQTKALVARDLWGMNEYFKIMNEENEAVKKALEILEEKK